MTNMFEPLNSEEKKSAKKSAKNNDSKPILPVPHDAPTKIPDHYELGRPSMVWDYKNEKGEVLFKVYRFIEKYTDEEGKEKARKEDRPLTYRKFPNGDKKWIYKGVDKPRPLYNLDKLANNPDAPIIGCEGEKAAVAADEIFSDHVSTTSPNGAGSPQCADWKPLGGRTLFLWPDNDSPGANYAKNVARLGKRAGAKSVKIVQIPSDFPEGWDLADPLPAGYDSSIYQKLLDEAAPVIDPLENLVERATLDRGEAYKPEVTEALSALKREDRPAYETLRAALKKAKVGISGLEDYMHEQHSNNGANPEPDQLELALEVVDSIGYQNILSTKIAVWLWKNSGVWQAVADREVKHLVQNSLADNGLPITRSLIDSVADVMKTEIYAQEHEWNVNKDAVNVLNGELHWNGVLWELRPHCREHFRTTQIPFNYDTDARCPRFLQFLNEVFAGDADAAEKATLILEMIGYTLMSHALMERFILLIGSGANGKSVLLELIRVLLGRENVCAVQPSQFNNKFQRAHLHMKLANLVTEIAEGGEIADAELKAITSGELTTAEHKNKDPFDFCPFSTCWFGTNHLPYTRDFSDALFRRALVVRFNNTFKEGANADPNLKVKLQKELAGIMKLALDAFGKVINRSAFTEPQSCIEAKSEWKLEADQAAQFAEERCILHKDAEIASGELYKEYEHWAGEAGISRKLNHKNFTRRLERLGCKTRKGTAGIRLIERIRLKNYQDN